MYPWNHLRGLSYPWMPNHGYLRGGSYECNYNKSMGTFVSMKSFEGVELSMDDQSWILWGRVLWMATTMNPWVHLYPWNHLSGLSYPWMSNHGYLRGGILWMATTMCPWVTMDTLVVHNTSPADSCKLNREGTPWSSRHSKPSQCKHPFRHD